MSNVISEIAGGIEAIARARRQGLAGTTEPLRPMGVNVLVFERDRQAHFGRHRALLAHLCAGKELKDLEVWQLEADHGRFCGFIVLVGDAHSIQWYVKSAYYLESAESFVANEFSGDWRGIEPTRSATDTPWIGCAMKLAEAEQQLRDIEAAIAPQASRLVAVSG
jgi:hypothetical protein